MPLKGILTRISPVWCEKISVQKFGSFVARQSLINLVLNAYWLSGGNRILSESNQSFLGIKFPPSELYRDLVEVLSSEMKLRLRRVQCKNPRVVAKKILNGGNRLYKRNTETGFQLFHFPIFYIYKLRAVCLRTHTN